MKGIQNSVLALLLGVIVLIIAVTVVWLVLSGYLKFGTKISEVTLKGVTCGVCPAIPDPFKAIFCGGC